jgi:CubicO group peptidase (beta-lactamase class C family)
MLNKLMLMCFVTALLCGLSPARSALPQANPGGAEFSAIVERFRQEIQGHMQQDSIPGLAIAIVDDQHILWMEGFGYTDGDKKIAVTPHTLFSIQSMSKSFTATAAMFAAQAGLVDLDAPITAYLPDFTVNSVFEEHPEQKITLRMLLSHTAGFAHEAPFGGNFDLPAYSFVKHIASISDTWLKFPVGDYYSYSNLGVDLAGYILQVQSGMPFTQYVQETLLQPLGMNESTLDVSQVRANKTRAIGHVNSPFPPPVDFLIIPSGGVWSTASDMARYLQFHILEGAMDGQRLLQPGLAETMYTPPNLAAAFSDYALGIALSERNGARHFQHGGGGFGFNSSMVWYPDLQLGSVVLTNSMPQEFYAYDLSEAVLDAIIASNPAVYTPRSTNVNQVAPTYPPLNDKVPLTDGGLRSLIASQAVPMDAAALSRRSAYAGTYIIDASGFPDAVVKVSDNQGVLSAIYPGASVTLTEVEPGLFLAPSGDTFDFREAQPLFLNIHMLRITPQARISHLVIYILCGLVFLSMLLIWPIRAIVRTVQRRKSTGTPAQRIKGAPWEASAAWLMALASLISLACMAIVVIIPNMIYLPWPHPYTEMRLWQQGLLYLPYLSLALAVIAALLGGMAYRRKGLAPSMRKYFVIVVLALVAFNIVLLV